MVDPGSPWGAGAPAAMGQLYQDVPALKASNLTSCYQMHRSLIAAGADVFDVKRGVYG